MGRLAASSSAKTPSPTPPAGTSRFASEVLVYGGALALARGVSFLLTPLFARVLSTEAYGALEILNVTRQILLVVVGLGMRQALLRFHARTVADGGEAAERTLLGTALAAPVGLGAIAVVAAALAGPYLSQAVLGRPSLSLEVTLVVAAAVAEALFEIFLHVYRARRRAVPYAASLAGTMVAFGVAASVAVLAGAGLVGIFASRLAVFVLALAVVWRAVVPGGPRLPSLPLWPRLVAFAVPLVPAALAWMVVQAADRYFLGSLVGLEAVAVYAVGAKASSIVGLALVSPFQLAWPARVFRRHADAPEALPAEAATTLSRMGAVLLLGMLGLALFSREAVTVLAGSRYLAAASVTYWLLAAWPGVALYYWAGTLLQVERSTLWVAGVSGFAALCNVVLNLVLIPPHGLLGAAWASAASMAAAGAAMLLLLPRPWLAAVEWGRLVRLVALGVAGFWGATLLNGLDPGLHWGAAALLWIGAAFLLLTPFFATGPERRRLARLLGGLRR